MRLRIWPKGMKRIRLLVTHCPFVLSQVATGRPVRGFDLRTCEERAQPYEAVLYKRHMDQSKKDIDSWPKEYLEKAPACMQT